MYLLDAHSLIYQVFHAIPGMSGPKGQPTNAVFGFTGDLLRLRRKNPDYLVCVFDPPGKTFRDDLYAEYKANRAPMPDELSSQFPLIRRVLDAMRIPVVMVDGFEADDAIATLARQGETKGLDVFICTGDKDIRQLLSDRIKIYNLRKDVILDREFLHKEWGITPEQVIDFLALVGDSVDNVPGIPGVGPKTATKLLQEYGDIDNLLANRAKIKQPKLRENLDTLGEKLALSRTLIKLALDVPVPADWEAWRLQPWDSAALLEVFRECGFHRYATEVRESEKNATPQAAGQLDLFSAADGSTTAPPSWTGAYHVIDTPANFTDFLEKLRSQERFALEIETTSRDPRQTEIIGYAIAWQPEEGYYLPVRGPADQPLLDPVETLQALRPVLENPAIGKVNQNIKHEVTVLRAAGVRLAGVAGDSMIASYLLTSGERNHTLDELSTRYLGHQPTPITGLIGKGKSQQCMEAVEPTRVAAYAGAQADAAWQLCELLEPKLTAEGLDRLYREVEVPLVEVLAELEYNGIRVDVPLLKRLSDDFASQLAALEQDIYALAGHPFNIGSPKQLRQVLFDELQLPRQRKTSITGEASTGQDVLEELAATGQELPRKIIDHRQIAKLKGTYVDALPALVNARTGRVHTSFGQTVAATGRLSSSDPNLQNIPIRTEMGRQIRQAFVPGPPGWLILTADYSQIELRVLAHFSQDAELQRAFQEDRDIHAYVAAQIYGVAENEVTSEQRRIAKMVNFGVIYGLSAFGLAQRLDMEQDEAAKFIAAYFAKYPGVLAFQDEILTKARIDGHVSTILGRRRAIEGIRARSSYKQRNQPEREALNAVIQGSAADLIKVAMINIHRRLQTEKLASKMLLQIHDELVFETPPEEKDPLARLVEKEMTTALELKVPVKVDLGVGANWLDTETIPSI